jgi:hypothetical protein
MVSESVLPLCDIGEVLTSFRARVKTERARNPTFSYNPVNQFNSYVETAIYFELFQDPATKTASLEFVKIFFGKSHNSNKPLFSGCEFLC